MKGLQERAVRTDAVSVLQWHLGEVEWHEGMDLRITGTVGFFGLGITVLEGRSWGRMLAFFAEGHEQLLQAIVAAGHFDAGCRAPFDRFANFGCRPSVPIVHCIKVLTQSARFSPGNSFWEKIGKSFVPEVYSYLLV
jgi:hypothetical protein